MLLLLFRPLGSSPPPPVEVIDTHDGERQREAKFRERNKRLRDQLEAAFEGSFGQPAQEALAEFIEPQVADSLDLSAFERVAWERVWQRREEVARRLEQLEQLARAQEADDEDSMLLLS